MLKKIIAVVAALAFISLTSVGIAQQQVKSGTLKIGSVDIQKALNTCEAGKAAAAKLNKALEDAKKKYEAQGQALQKEQEALERQSSVLDEQVFKDKVRDFQSRARDWDRFRKDVETDIRQQHNEIVDKISKELIGITEQVGKEGGFTLVVERSLVPYIDPTLDITDEVIKRYDQKSGAKSGAVPSAK
ncbi:MAG TPA: OmpH family outer membrane protein [Thermodesulfobacteriota bacterium]|nr:OmpH family outer membrane protein [Thermodesulfobacteriota bacterium]